MRTTYPSLYGYKRCYIELEKYDGLNRVEGPKPTVKVNINVGTQLYGYNAHTGKGLRLPRLECSPYTTKFVFLDTLCHRALLALETQLKLT